MKTMQFTFSDDLHKRLKNEAWKRKDSMGNTVRAVLDERLPAFEDEPESGISIAPSPRQ